RRARGRALAGRDVLPPAVAYHATGVPLAELGPVIDPAGLVPGLVGLPREVAGALEAGVGWVERFGDCQLNLGPDELEALGAQAGGRVEVRVGDQARAA